MNRSTPTKKLVLTRSGSPIQKGTKKLVLTRKPAPKFTPNQFKTPKSKGARAKYA